jgi:VWFA-related protein
MRLVITLLMAAALGCAQDPGVGAPAVFRAEVALVHVEVEVTAADGRVLDGFTKGDFRVLDEGKEQRLLHLASYELPLDLILLFDVSGSMRPVVAAVGEAAREGFRELRDGDRVAVMTFNTKSRVVLPFTENLEEVANSIERDVLGEKFGGGTFIQSAVDDAAQIFLNQPRTGRRRAVLIVTDNAGIRTRREATVVRNYWEADALLTGLVVSNPTLHKLQTVSAIMGPHTLLIRAGMKGIAEKTGGDFIQAGEPGVAFRDAVQRIRSRFGLYYAMPAGKPGSRRRVRVELAREAAGQYPKARVRARTGYIVPDGK